MNETKLLEAQVARETAVAKFLDSLRDLAIEVKELIREGRADKVTGRPRAR